MGRELTLQECCQEVDRLQVRRAQRRLIERALRGRRGRVALLLDATTNGATARRAGSVTLGLAQARRGCIAGAAVGAPVASAA